MINHDKLFKQVIGTFFVDFGQLFLAWLQIIPESVTELPGELFSDLETGKTSRLDLIRKVRLDDDTETVVVVMVEPQAYEDAGLGERIHRYYERLCEKYNLDVWPVVVISYDYPLEPVARTFERWVKDRQVLLFKFDIIQLNQLKWQDYVLLDNPIACAFASKMAIGKRERAKAKLAIIRQLLRLGLNAAQRHLIRGFISTYLRLEPAEKEEFEMQIQQLDTVEQEEVLVLTDEWFDEGRLEGRLEVINRLLGRKFGPSSQARIERIRELTIMQLDELTDKMLDFTSPTQLDQWLNAAEQ